MGKSTPLRSSRMPAMACGEGNSRPPGSRERCCDARQSWRADLRESTMELISNTAMGWFAPSRIGALPDAVGGLPLIWSCSAIIGQLAMIPIYAPKSESEAAVIVSLMQAYGVRFLMRGGAFSSMYPGPITNSLNAQMLMVDEADVDLAHQLLEPFAGDQSSG